MDDLFRFLDLHAARVISNKHARGFKQAVRDAQVEWRQLKEQVDKIDGRSVYSGSMSGEDTSGQDLS